MEQRSGGAIRMVLGFLVLLWIVELMNAVLGHRLNAFGVLPRTLGGLVGIPLSPFLHAGFAHLLLNTVPLLVLGAFVALEGRKVWLEVTAFVALLGGALLWVFGRTAYHVGASGLIYGYFGYVVGRGWYDRKPRYVVLALAALVLYGGLSWGLLPTLSRVSWEGHLFGLVAGILGARLAGNSTQKSAIP